MGDWHGDTTMSNRPARAATLKKTPIRANLLARLVRIVTIPPHSRSLNSITTTRAFPSQARISRRNAPIATGKKWRKTSRCSRVFDL